jgi:hypothetical protein
VVPTPHGPIRVSRHPDGVEIELPDGVNGVTDGGQKLSSGRNSLNQIPSAPALKKLKPTYPNAWLESIEGYPTAGHWDGWYAFCGQPNGADRSYGLEGISVHIPSDRVLAVPRRELFALEMNTDECSGAMPVKGALRTRVPEICGQNFTIDVIGEGLSQVEEFGIFCLDQGKEGIRQTVDLLELPGLHLCLPTRLVEDFSKGVIHRFRPKGPFRLRVSQCYGPDAAISGLCFKFK